MPRTIHMILLVCLVACVAAPGAMGRNHLEIFGADQPVQKNTIRTLDAGVFNLVVQEFTAPATARQGEDVSGAVTFVFRNDGPDDITEAFMARIFLTDDVEGELEVQEYLFWTTVPGLGTGESWVFEGGASVPLSAPAGAGYLVAEVDLYDSLQETDETDNRAILDFTVEETPVALVYYEDFQDGDGGWQPRDLTKQEVHLQHTRYDVPEHETSYGVWWCGDEDPLWGTPPGYGSSWEQRLTKQYDLPAGEALSLAYAIQYDTDENNDVIHVEVSDNNGGSFDLLAVHSGSSQGEFLFFEQDLTAYAGRRVLLRFRFKSDGSWDDEAGNLDTDGAYRLDFVEVSGHGRDDFEEDDGGWDPSAADPVGGEFQLLSNPVYTRALPGDVYDTGAPATTCNAWAAYDPTTYEFPDASPTERADGRNLEIVIESPVIDLPASWSHVLLSFDVYEDLPLANGVYYRYFVSADGGPWVTDGRIYFGTEGWKRREFDITAHLPDVASSLRVRLAANDFGFFWGWDPPVRTAAPYFDNVSLQVSESSDPGLDPVFWPRACGWSADDTDGDGVLDVMDLCPTESAAFFDRDGDGCLDPVRGSRHIEYWSADMLPLGYVIHEGGAPGINDGSDLTAVRAGFNTWTEVPGADVTVEYLGTTPDPDADALDMVNTVTFADPDFKFPSGVLAVGLSTSYLTPVVDGENIYRPGQIIDADMIFNPAESFRTASSGTGVDIRSIVAHEAGHMLGLSHSAVQTSTMFFVLPPGTDGSVLSAEDRSAMFRAYPDEVTLEYASHLRGNVLDGRTGEPVPGVIVFAIEALPDGALGDTVSCDFTLPADGSFHFAGLDDGDYFLSIHALDGSSEIGYIQPGNINRLIYNKAENLVVPEFWDAEESGTDDPEVRSPIAVAGGVTSQADILTNIDEVGPYVVNATPVEGSLDVAVSTAVLFQFSEAVDPGSFAGNFDFRPAAGGDFVPGNAALVHDDKTLMYIPAANLAFDTPYVVEVGPDVRDLFGNPMGETFTLTFATGPRPAVYIANLAPARAVPGALVVVNGDGFGSETDPAEVTLGGVPLPLLEWAADRLLVRVPDSMAAGPYDLVVTDPLGSGTATAQFTVLEPEEVARGLELATLDLPGLPRVVDVTPDGRLSLVATDQGLAAIDVSVPAAPTLHFLATDGGLNDLDISPDGSNIYAVSQDDQRLFRYNYDSSVASPGSPVALLDEIPLAEVPRGLVIDPQGKRAYVATVDEIQIWDIHPTSATYHFQVGTLVGTGPAILGTLAFDPGGRYLLATTGTGRLAVFDPRAGTLLADIPVQANPVDVQIAPAGDVAYVTDDNGYLSVVDLNGLVKVRDVLTGGSLQGASLTPTASFLYATNHQEDDLDVIDLRPGSSTYHGLATRIPSRVNPVDVAFSPAGSYAYTLVEYERKFVVTAMGSGPLLETLQPAWGPAGTRVTVVGSGFNGASVSFNGNPLPVDHAQDGGLVVTIPEGAVTGPLTVVGAEPGEISNSLTFTVLGPDDGGPLTDIGSFRSFGEPEYAALLAVSSDGRLVAVGGEDGYLYLFDTDPASSAYQTFAPPIDLASGAMAGLALSPDGTKAFAAGTDSPTIHVVDVDPANETHGEIIRNLPVGGEGLGRLAVSHDGTRILAADSYEAVLHLCDVSSGEAVEIAVPGGPVGEIAFHPGGLHAYLALNSDDPAGLAVVDLDEASETYGQITTTLAMPVGDPDPVPLAMSFTPDGRTLFVMTSQLTGTPVRSVLSVEVTDPAAPGPHVLLSDLTTEALPVREDLAVSPSGDRLVLNVSGDGIYQATLDPFILGGVPDVTLPEGELALAFSPDATRLYAADAANDLLRIFDFNGDKNLVPVWGTGQTGVAGEELPSPLRVRVTDLDGRATVGATVYFEVTGGGGVLASSQPLNSGTQLTLATDTNGYAQVDWTLGPVVGPQEVMVSSPGATGSPLVVTATAIEDPELLPLVLVEDLFHPQDGAVDVSVTTAVLATFSRPVDPVSLHPDSYFLWDQTAAAKVSTIMGFADGNRTVSLTPLADLAYATTYTVVVGSAVKDAGGGMLTNIADVSFTTEAAPPAPYLAAVNPGRATPVTEVVLSGTGFDPVFGNNEVVFVDGGTLAETSAFVSDGATDFLRVTVPIGEWEGTVYVTGPTGPSNALPFTILEETSQPADEVLGRVATGAPVKAVTVSPDGAMAYALSPEADLVVPVDLATLASLPGIPVGDEPWAVAAHPAGTYVYVANRMSGDVSVVDILAGSGTYHEVVGVMNVGYDPVDLVVTPSGDRVIVANGGSEDLSIIDTDETSASFHNVIGTVRTGTPTRTVTVTPDGGRVYVGTETGYLVLGTLDYGVIGRVTTGTATKTLTVTPDGTLLVLLDVAGEITVYDIAPGSETENQVIASVRTGGGAKTATVSPDGALLYVVMEEDDIVNVFSLEVEDSIGALETQTVRPIEFLMLVATIRAGENPEDLAFVGGDPRSFVVSNSGDQTLTVYGGFTPGTLSGRVLADCPEPGTAMAGIPIDIFLNETGDLFTTLQTDTLGRFEIELPAGIYNATLLTPLGYLADDEVAVVEIGGGADAEVEWTLGCLDIVPSQRPMSYWKHQVGWVLREDKTDLELDAETLCNYLDIIESHFNNHVINQVVIYDPPPSGECYDKLAVAKDLLNLRGYDGMISHAKQQAMALLFNVASGKLSLQEVVSEDGATVGRAITYLDILIDDGIIRNDLNAVLIAKAINHGQMLPAGEIPVDLPDIFYLPRAGRTRLEQNFPNPFNPSSTIRFEIAAPSQVRLKIYDVRGVLVRTLVDEPRRSGLYTVVWDGNNERGGPVASGVYFYRLTAGNFEQTHKMMLLK